MALIGFPISYVIVTIWSDTPAEPIELLVKLTFENLAFTVKNHPNPFQRFSIYTLSKFDVSVPARGLSTVMLPLNRFYHLAIWLKFELPRFDMVLNFERPQLSQSF